MLVLVFKQMRHRLATPTRDPVFNGSNYSKVAFEFGKEMTT